MKITTLGTAMLALGALAANPAEPSAAAIKQITDDYFGTQIVDPYRWRESEPEPQFTTYLHTEND